MFGLILRKVHIFFCCVSIGVVNIVCFFCLLRKSWKGWKDSYMKRVENFSEVEFLLCILKK